MSEKRTDDTAGDAPKPKTQRVRDSANPKAERKKRNEELARHRMEYFQLAMANELPKLGSLGIPKDATSLDQEQQAAVARIVQSGLVARVLLHHIGNDDWQVPESIKENEQDGMVAETKRLGIIDLESPTRKDAKRLCDVAERGTQARDFMMQMNLGFVMLLTRREARKKNLDPYTYEEILEEAKIGMVNAIDHFDPDAGFRLTTYATWWIRQKIMDYLNSRSKLIRMPANMNTLYRRIAVAMKYLRQEYQSDDLITPKVIYEWMDKHDWDVSYDDIENAIKVRKETISIDAFVSDDDTRTLDSTLASSEDIATDTAHTIDAQSSFKRLLGMVSDPLSRKIMQEIYEHGDASNAKSVGDVARRHNLTTHEVQHRIEVAQQEIQKTIEFSMADGIPT